MTDFTPQIDPVVPQGTPLTVLLPVTGHVLSLPVAVEGFASYCWRVHRQCLWPDQADDRGAILFNTSAIFSQAGQGYDDAHRENWPLVADMHYNHEAYLTPDQRAQLEQAKAQWAAAEANIGQQQPSSGQAHAAQLHAHAHAADHARKGGSLAAGTIATGTVSDPTPQPAAGDGPAISQG